MTDSTRIVRWCVLGLMLLLLGSAMTGCATSTPRWHSMPPDVAWTEMERHISSLETEIQTLRNPPVDANPLVKPFQSMEIDRAENRLDKAKQDLREAEHRLAGASAQEIEIEYIVAETRDAIIEELPSLTGDYLVGLYIDTDSPEVKSSDLLEAVMNRLRTELSMSDTANKSFNIIGDPVEAEKFLKKYGDTNAGDLLDPESGQTVDVFSSRYIYRLHGKLDTRREQNNKRLHVTTFIDVDYPHESNRLVWSRKFTHSYHFHPTRGYISESDVESLRAQWAAANAN